MVTASGEVMISESKWHFDKTWLPAARRNWSNLTEVFRSGLMLKHLVNGPLELTIPRVARESQAEHLIKAFANICKFRNVREGDGCTWVSDGSMKLASATIEEEKVVLGAVTGPSTLVLKIPGHNVSILHGEQVGLIIALILARQNSSDTQSLLTDHQNSVRLIEDSRSNVSQVPRLCNMNGRAYYRWILSLIDRTDTNVK